MPVKNFIPFLCLIIALSGYAQTTRIFNQPLVDSLAKWSVIDQEAALRKPDNPRFKNFTSQQWYHYGDSVMATHKPLLEKIFNTYGFPGYDRVGKEGSNNFWRMVQHCDQFPGFQLKVLKAMKKEVMHGNADEKSYAYLTDRVKLNTGKKQLYGTQVTYNLNTCQAYPKPTADSLNLNKRRKQIGLEPVETYLNMLSQLHFMSNKAMYEAKGIHEPKLYAVPKP